jgi:hypothetical protein
MAYLDKRTGRLFYGEAKHPKLGRVRRRFKTKDLAEAYETHVRAHGEEPAWALTGDEAPGRTFADVCGELKAAGGPGGYPNRMSDAKAMPTIVALNAAICRRSRSHSGASA